MPEGVMPYPRWEGDLSERSRIPTIMWNEFRTAIRSRWAMLALLLGLAWGFASVLEFYNLRESGAGEHGWEAFLAMHRQLLWFALGVAAAVGATTLLEDARSGALDLYMGRAVTTRDYLAGKVLALMGLTTLLIWIPALFLWATSYVFYDGRPDDWLMAPLMSLVFALMWSLLVSGLALGLSAVARSASGAALLLFGGFALLAYLVDPPGILQRVATITALTEDPRWAVLSPFAVMNAQLEWLFPEGGEAPFPYWWGLIVWGFFVVLGWGLLAWRHPTVKGVRA